MSRVPAQRRDFHAIRAERALQHSDEYAAPADPAPTTVHEMRAAGGVYLWRTMEAARRARDAVWLDRVRRTYGSEPNVQYFETPLIADNALGQTVDEAENDEMRSAHAVS
jgi:hypothetical protein